MSHIIKSMPLISFRKGTSGVGDVAVKLNLKGGLLSCILPQDAAIGHKIQFCLLKGKLLLDFQIALKLFNFEAKINCNTTRQNVLNWRKKCTRLKFDLVHFNGPQTKFICDSLYKHPVCLIMQQKISFVTLLIIKSLQLSPN